MNIRKDHAGLILSASAAWIASGASAGLVGDTVALWRTPQLTGVPTLDAFAIVTDPGIEFQQDIAGNLIYTLDLDATSIRLDSYANRHSPWFNSGFAPSSIEIRGMDFGPGLSITGVEVSYSTNIGRHDSAPDDLPFFSADNISFIGDTVRISYGGHEFVEGSWVRIDLIVTPAPAGLGVLAGAGLLACRRRRSA